MEQIRLGLKEYIDNNVIPQYRILDEAHGPEHIRQVIDRSIYMAKRTGADVEMAYVIAAYHDIGIKVARKGHGIYSAEILRGDMPLKKWFGSNQLQTMSQAIEDHSTSLEKEPRSLYGKIIYQADKTLEADLIIKRAVKYGIRNYNGYSSEEQAERVYKYINNKYGENGLFKFWIDIPEEKLRLRRLQKQIKDKDYVYMICQKHYL